MPIFGLVWVASWVGCFFPSHQSLLKTPNYPLCVFSTSGISINHARNRAVKVPNAPTLALRLEQHSLKKRNQFATKRVAPTQQTLMAPSPTFLELQSVHSLGNLNPESGGLLKLLRGVFLHWQTVKPASDKIPAVTAVLPAKPQRRSSKDVWFSFSRTGGACPQPLSDAKAIRDRGCFQIKLGTAVVGETTTRQQAMAITQKLKTLLDNPFLQPAQLTPGLVNGIPGVKLGDRTLFHLDQALMQHQNCNPELLVIQWVNNLRTALSEPPLPLVTAQADLYALEETNQTIQGLASWYGPYFHGRQTATGETFDQNEFTAAHPSLPFDTYLKVTNHYNGKSIIVRVNDRGPYFDNRTLDLSREAARALDSESTGVVPFEAVIMKPIQMADSSTSKTAVLQSAPQGEDDMTVFINN